MVFFTCNACGQSIRKNRVEKHWQTECRNCEVLSCIDCGKDFYGEEYAGHTSCITEAEKYQGALFKGERGGASKGEKKQQEWIHNITEMISSRDFPPRIKNLLEKVLDYPNIPRKKSKFQNFLKNSINVKDASTLDRLWDIFTEASQKKTETPTALATPNSCDVVNEKEIGIESETDEKKEEKGNHEKCDKRKEDNDVVMKKKKRKRDKKGDRNDDEEQTRNEVESNESDNSVVIKKNKKKKEKVELGERKRDRKNTDDDNSVIEVRKKKPKIIDSNEDIRKTKTKKHKQ